jgi:hypothetical protein
MVYAEVLSHFFPSIIQNTLSAVLQQRHFGADDRNRLLNQTFVAYVIASDTKIYKAIDALIK